MPERVAVFGSRQGIHPRDVSEFVAEIHNRYPDTILVSGGAEGVDTQAEQTYMLLEGTVWSFRPHRLPDGPDYYPVWTVARWILGPNPDFDIPDPMTFADHKSALMYRSMLMAEVADRGVAFWANRSPGTSHTIDFFGAYPDKPLYVYKEGL